MDIKDEEMVKRYIHELTRYMDYEEATKASNDVILMLKEKLGKNYTSEELYNSLNNLGNPYGIASKYIHKNNFYINNKSYKIYIKILIILFLSSIFAIIFFKYMNKNLELETWDIINIIKLNLIEIFLITTISVIISEKIKITKTINSLISEFNVKELINKKYTNVEFYLTLLIFVYSFIIFFILNIFRIGNNQWQIKLLEIILFLNIFRDFNKLSEGRYEEFLSFIMIICDSISIILEIILYRNSNFILNIKIIFLMLCFLQFWDFIKALFYFIYKLRRFI